MVVLDGTDGGAPAGPASFSPRTAGRLAGSFFLGSGLLVLAALPFPALGRVSRPAIIAIALTAIAVGLFARFAPWNRWPPDATLMLAPVGLGLISAGTYFALEGDSPEVALVYLVAICAWIGVGHRRWTTLWLAPAIAAAWFVPVMARTGDLVEASQVVFALPICVLVGELLGWVTTRLRSAERSLRAANLEFEQAYEREREAAERLRELDEMKTAILSAVSHDLRTPITAVLGYARTLQRMEPERAAQHMDEFLEGIVGSARRLDRLVADLLDLDRLTRGVLEPNRRPTDLAGLVNNVVGGLDLGSHPLETEVDGVTVEVDAARVERIVENLISNAAKYTPPGTPIWVRVGLEGEDALIVVEDAGPGVPEAERDGIFQPFRRGATAGHRTRGTGIGLSLVAHFAEIHGGKAWVEDREGGGASFRVLLPAPRVEDKEPRELPPAEAPVAAAG